MLSKLSEANGSDDSAKKKETDRPSEETVSDENSKKDGTDGQLDGSITDKENNPLDEDSSLSFGSIPKDGTTFGGTFGLDKTNSSFPSLGLGTSNNGTPSLQLFGSSTASDATKSEKGSLPTMQEVPVETGEENEKSVFTADAILFEYLDGSWKQRGKGELRVNVLAADVGKPRLMMRARGNYRLILNASLYLDMKLTNMDKRGITFACMNSANSEGKQGALKFKDGSIVDEF